MNVNRENTRFANNVKHTYLDIIYIYVFLVIDWRLEMRGVVMKRMLILN
jgi:hypothetical protein